MNTINGRALPAIICALALTLFGCSKQDTPAAPPAPTVAVQGQKATEAEFANPGGLAVDAAGNLYVTDGHAIRKITPDGMVTAFAGQPGTEGHADGKAEAATFAAPAYLATDGAGNVYVADSGNHNVRVITSGGVVTTQAKVDTPTGIATDSAGNLYVSDPYQGTKKYPAQGAGAQAAGVSLAGGNLDIGGIATDGAGNVYLVNQARSVITKVKPDGKASILAGSPGLNGSDDGQGQAAHFRKPTGIAVDSAGNVFVADTGNHAIRKITPAGAVTTLAGKASETGYADGAGDAARFDAPRGIAVDKGGNVYVTDQHKTIRKITAAGMVSTFAGRSPVAPVPAAASAAAVNFGDPHWLATDRAGNLYISDLNLSGIRKIAPGGAVDNVGDAWGKVGGIATDSAGNVYFTNYETGVLSRVDPSGAVTALASGLNQPFCVTADGAGNLYVSADQNATIRKITRDGKITIFAGTPGQKSWADGSGQAARFNSPRGLATDSAGNLYVADFVGNTIRKITPAGVVSTLAGSPGVAGGTDGKGADARFNGPIGLATDSAGNVYVADSQNKTIRKITPDGTVSTIAGTPADTSAEEPAEDNSEPEGYDHKDDSMPSGDEAPADDSPK